ncbi:hypothetical protein [Halorientalis regularis]|uniref:hypothetical protein n=1 Tax=Halorientalis regularis TaxID=660518 RepID=UPI0011145725|nr:hypothetical protein [Halorientalis regularis]
MSPSPILDLVGRRQQLPALERLEERVVEQFQQWFERTRLGGRGVENPRSGLEQRRNGFQRNGSEEAVALPDGDEPGPGFRREPVESNVGVPVRGRSARSAGGSAA